MLITAVYLLAIFGRGGVLTVASYVPVASTVTMPARLFTGGVPWWQVLLSLAAAVLFVVAGVALAGRLYRGSVMQTRGRIRLRAALTSSE